MRKGMEVNVFGIASMIRGFALILANNGGGAIVNMLSVVSWFTPPFNATYAASKHAAQPLRPLVDCVSIRSFRLDGSLSRFGHLSPRAVHIGAVAAFFHWATAAF